MHGEMFQLAFIGPGGPEILVVMLVLILLFGAKDAPRVLRKLNELFNRMRSMTDSVRREVMYGDLYHDAETDAFSEEVYVQSEDDDTESFEDTGGDRAEDVEKSEDGDAKQV